MKEQISVFLSTLKDTLKGPFKWFIIIFLTWLYRVEFMSDAGVGIGKSLQVGTIVLMTYLLWRQDSGLFKNTLTETNKPVKSLIWLYIFALVSTLWAFLPSFAFFLSFQNLLMIMLFTWVFSLFDDFHQMERGVLFLTMLIVLMELAVSRLLSMHLFGHDLSCASISAIMLAYCIGEYLNMTQRDTQRATMLKTCMIVHLFNMVINTSGGANASAVVAIGVAMFLGGKKGYAVFIMVIGLYLFFNQELIDDIILALMPGKNRETIQTGNGRDAMWEHLLNYAQQKPWLGWGFACIERVNQLGVIGNQSLSDAHSNYVGMYGSLGIVGCVLFGWHLVSTGLHLFRRMNRIGFLGLFTAFVCATVNGYSYGYLSGKTCSITIGYIIVVLLSYFDDVIPEDETTAEELKDEEVTE